MSLADEFEQLEYVRPRRCGLCSWLDKQAAEVRSALTAAHQRGVPATELHKVAVRNGLDLGSRQFGECLRTHHAL